MCASVTLNFHRNRKAGGPKAEATAAVARTRSRCRHRGRRHAGDCTMMGACTVRRSPKARDSRVCLKSEWCVVLCRAGCCDVQGTTGRTSSV